MQPATGSKLPAPAEGQRCFGRFVLGRELGRSAIAAVWLARDEANTRNVALKLLTEQLALDSAARADLKRQVDRVKSLRRDTFARVFELLEDAGRVAISSEFVSGITFANLRDAGADQRIAATELALWMDTLGSGFDEAHRAGMVHGALHPGHLVITPDRQLKVLDFGIARTLLDAAARHDRKVLESAPSHAYASPQLRAGSPPTPRDDVYAFGATLRDLLTTPAAGLGTKRDPLIVSGAWEDTIRTCLAEDPEQRPATIRIVLDQLGFVPPPQAPNAKVAENPIAPAIATVVQKSERKDDDRPLLVEKAPEPDGAIVTVTGESRARSPGEGIRPSPAAPIVTTLPEIHEARAVAAQRAHHKGALVAFVCLGVVWFGLRMFSERVLPPAIPPHPKGMLASALPVGGSSPVGPRPDVSPQSEPAAAPPAITPTPVEVQRPPPTAPEQMLADARREMPAAPPESLPPPPVATVPPNPPPVANLTEVVPSPSTPPVVTPPPSTSAPAPTAAAPPPPAVAAAPAPAPPPPASATTPPAAVANTSPPLAVAVPPAVTVLTPTPTPPAAPPPVATPPVAAPAPPVPAAVAVPPGPRRAEPVPSSRPPKVGQRWTNSLGMPFAPVPSFPILVAIWETRVRDFDAFVKATGAARKGVANVAQGDHPVTNVSFLDATRFCGWLTNTETAAGRLKAPQHYRLPTDAEWSAAAGIRAELGATLRERDNPGDRTFAWGNQWPPPPGAGNFRGVHAPEVITDADSYEQAAPVGTFAPNRLGLFDLGGNAAEMVSDLIAPELGLHATRGASFADADERTLRLRARGVGENDHGSAPHLGFRIVLDLGPN